MKWIIIGMVCGLLTGLGMGGGSLLIVILTSFFHMEQHISQAMNICFYIPTSVTALLIYLKHKQVDTVVGQKLLYAVILGSFLGSYMAQTIETSQLKKFFAGFIFVVGMADVIQTMRMMAKKKGRN